VFTLWARLPSATFQGRLLNCIDRGNGTASTADEIDAKGVYEEMNKEEA